MQIAVNTRLLLKNKLEGLGRFTDETLKLIVQQHPEHQFDFLFDRPFSDEFVYADNVNPIVVNPPARHPVLWHIWFQMSLPRVINRIKPDVFLSPDGFLSLNSKVASLPVIHDLNFVHNPEDLAKSHSWFYNRYFPKYAQKAKRIATVSEFSKQDISSLYKIDPDKIDVVYNGVSERFKPVSEQEKSAVRQQWTEGKPYFIFVGAIHQRKNIERMLRAYDQFRASSSDEFRFVFAGNRKWWTESMQQTFDRMEHKNEVIFAGRVPDTELNDLLGAALANVYVSTFEGFGIPIIEAFQAQVPVITSNTTSMPEIAAEAALVVDPMDEKSIAKAMKKLASSVSLQNELITKGKERAKNFTWQRTADLLWESVVKTAE